MSERFASMQNQAAGIALLLGLILNAIFFPYIWGDMNLLSASHDVPSVTDLGGPNGDPARPISVPDWKLLDPNGSGLVTEPTFPLVHHELFIDHQLPLWNPDIAFGTPLAAAMQQQPFFPLTPLVMLHPSPTTYAIFIVLRLFLAGFACYLFMRFFVGVVPGLCAAIAFMLNGYFTHYSTMPHLSVETLTSSLFLGVEWVLTRKRLWLSAPFLSAIVASNLLGGMPESSFIAIAFAATYGAYRIATVSDYRSFWWTRSRELAFSFACGFASAAFLLLPFAEFVVRSYNDHEAGKNGGILPALVPDSSPESTLPTYLMPLFLGPPWRSTLPINDGYFGICVTFLAIAAVAYALLSARDPARRPGASVIGFFAAAAVLLVAKRYGVPAVNWVGYLPMVRLIALGKYAESATGFAMAVLAGFGLQAIVYGRMRAQISVVVAGAAALLALQLSFDVAADRAAAVAVHATAYYYTALVGATVLLIVVAVAAFAAASLRSATFRAALAAFATFCVLLELTVNYFVPMYYFVDPGPRKAQNPYAGAPYIGFLHARTDDAGRIYGENSGYLFPNWAQAYDLKDVRDLDAIFNDLYLPFARNFVPAGGPDLIVGAGGSSRYTMASELGQRFLSLGSVHYVISRHMIDPESPMAQIQHNFEIRAMGPDTPQPLPERLDNVSIDAIAQNGAAQDLAFAYQVPSDARVLAFDIGVADDFWSKRNASARFEVAATLPGATKATLFSERLDSARRNGRGWLERSIDLRRYAGKTMVLGFTLRSNDPNSQIRGYWGRLAAERAGTEHPAFTLVRDADPIVYEYAHPLPHGAIFGSTRVSESDKTTLATLADTHFDIFKTAVVSANTIPASLQQQIHDLSQQKPTPVASARLESYTPERVTYSTGARGPSLFVLCDSFYPGWRAFVDGRETTIVRANYLFRGVVLEGGAHRIEFRYDPPSFKFGLAIAFCGMASVAWFGLATRRKALAREAA